MIVADKLALCIGNSNYTVLPKLCTGGYCQPRNDANDMAGVLYEAGFDTMVGLDLSLAGMEAKLAQFETKLVSGSYNTAMFFYAGHGAANKDKENFLIPVDCSKVDPVGIKYAAVSLDKVIDQMSSDSVASRVLLIDACRSLPRGGGPTGMQYLDPPQQTYIGYATGFGQVSGNGIGRNGLFTEGLLKYIRTKGQSLNDVFNRVTAYVEAKSGDSQSPTMSYRASQPFVLFPGVGNVVEHQMAVQSVAVPLNRNFTETAFGLDMKMIFVEGGHFDFGCTVGQGWCDNNVINPATSLSVADFYIGETEVTQRQWRAIMKSNPSYHTGCEECPVERISYGDAQEFISRLNYNTNRTYRLPSESEWEFAARGGVKSNDAKYSGSNNLDECGWYKSNSNTTRPSSQKMSNEIGIYDMSGNVWEWCVDWSVIGVSRVIRGGSILEGYDLNYSDTNLYLGERSSAETCKVSTRYQTRPSDRARVVGFRIACDVGAK